MLNTTIEERVALSETQVVEIQEDVTGLDYFHDLIVTRPNKIIFR